MTMLFIPDKGSVFYAESTMSFTLGGAIDALFLGVETKERVVKDRSYATDVFVCVGSDSRVVVGQFLTSIFKGRREILPITDFLFHPAGPDVISAFASQSLGEKA